MAENLVGALHAVLFAASNPLNQFKLCEILNCEENNLKTALAELEIFLNSSQSGVTLQKLAGGWRLATKSEYYDFVEKAAAIKTKKLSPALLETLAVIAWRQPATRQEIETVRGVNADSAVLRLLELDLIAEAGRKNTPGHPIMYRTTAKFLATFGLDDLADLPQLPEAIDENTMIEDEATAKNEDESEPVLVDDINIESSADKGTE